MNWRVWLYDFWRNDDQMVAAVPIESVYGAGSVEGAPSSRPFVVIRMLPKVRNNNIATTSRCQFWVHDDAGSYDRIDEIIALITSKLSNRQVNDVGAVTVRWEGTSEDLMDDQYRTCVKHVDFALIETEET